jgi:hypothetical protein
MRGMIYGMSVVLTLLLLVSKGYLLNVLFI